MIRKCLTVGIIVLLIANIAPLVSSLGLEKAIVKEKLNPASRSDSRGINITVTGTKGCNDWYVSNVIVSFTGSNTTYYYDINNGPWIELTGPPDIIFTIDGYYNVSAYCIYSNGSQSPIVTVSFKIDKTAPVVTQFICKRVGFFKWKLMADVYDNTSGINSVFFIIDDLWYNSTSSPYEAYWTGLMFLVFWKFRITDDWGYLPHCIPYDNAGNSGMQPNHQ